MTNRKSQKWQPLTGSRQTDKRQTHDRQKVTIVAATDRQQTDK